MPMFKGNMRKTFLFLILSGIVGTNAVGAVGLCVPINDLNNCISNVGSNTSEWSVTCYNSAAKENITFKGIAACSDNGKWDGLSVNRDLSLNYECMCNVYEPFLTKWLMAYSFEREYSDGYTTMCPEECAEYCASAFIENEDHFRDDLLEEFFE